MASKSHNIHEGKCGPCYLCRKESYKYTHLDKMDTTVVKLICDMEELPLSRDACICHACYKQASRNVENPHFHPRWRPKQKAPKVICSIEKCGQTMYRNTSIATPENIESLLGQKLSSSTNDAVEVGTVSTPLCQYHYTDLHTSLHSRQPCESCGCRPKWGERDHFLALFSTRSYKFVSLCD